MLCLAFKVSVSRISVDKPSAAGTRKEIQALRQHKSYGSDGFSSVLFKVDGREVVSFRNVWYSEEFSSPLFEPIVVSIFEKGWHNVSVNY